MSTVGIAPQTLSHWEPRFAESLRVVTGTECGRIGGLLGIVPARDEWEQFVACVRTVWRAWELAFSRHPATMLMLYDGVAFYRFVSGAFWEGFAETVGVDRLATSEQSAINRLYQMAGGRFGVEVADGNYVNSAVRHIGVPISMWESVLSVCEWALWTENWRTLDDGAWREAMTRRLGGRKRLIEFVVLNRENATRSIQEMLDARELLRDDRKLTLSDLAGVCHLRREYFEEVPETADFLREDDPDSLFADRARLTWDEERDTLSLHIPPVVVERLPATWRINGLSVAASDTAGALQIDGAAFAPQLRLELHADGQCAPQRLAGLGEWALWDEARRRFVPVRDHLPLAPYVLLSRQPLAPQLEGWASDPDDPATDLPRELRDGTAYFLTRLHPATRRPRLKIGEGQWLCFAERRDVIVRLFVGKNLASAARFGLTAEGVLRVEEWPRPFLEVPLSLLSDAAIAEEFRVFVDGAPAGGRWRTYSFEPEHCDETNAERALCFWEWDAQPLPPPPPKPELHRSFRTLDRHASPSPVFTGSHVLHVESRRLGRLAIGLRPVVPFELLAPMPRADFWPTDWGEYIALILLSQVQDDAHWEEVCFAREAVAMWKAKLNLHAVHYTIRKLERHGYLVMRGSRYLNFRHRIALGPTRDYAFVADYCGLTTPLFELVRAVPPLEMSVRTEPGRPPALELRWPQRDRTDVRAACERLKLPIVNKLW